MCPVYQSLEKCLLKCEYHFGTFVKIKTDGLVVILYFYVLNDKILRCLLALTYKMTDAVNRVEQVTSCDGDCRLYTCSGGFKCFSYFSMDTDTFEMC